MTINPEQLQRVGESFYGVHWQTPLARALGPHCPDPRANAEGLAPRVVRRWASGERPVPAWVPPALQEIAKERKRDLLDRGVALTRIARGEF